jgi:hypothetical protein
MRGKATVYKIPVPAALQEFCRARYRLVMRLRYPPEVWRQLDWELQVRGQVVQGVHAAGQQLDSGT